MCEDTRIHACNRMRRYMHVCVRGKEGILHVSERVTNEKKCRCSV
jgi:hypothetical protein